MESLPLTVWNIQSPRKPASTPAGYRNSLEILSHRCNCVDASRFRNLWDYGAQEEPPWNKLCVSFYRIYVRVTYLYRQTWQYLSTGDGCRAPLGTPRSAGRFGAVGEHCVRERSDRVAQPPKRSSIAGKFRCTAPKPSPPGSPSLGHLSWRDKKGVSPSGEKTFRKATKQLPPTTPPSPTPACQESCRMPSPQSSASAHRCCRKARLASPRHRPPTGSPRHAP